MNEEEFEFMRDYFADKGFSEEQIEEFKKDPMFWRRVEPLPSSAFAPITRDKIKKVLKLT